MNKKFKKIITGIVALSMCMAGNLTTVVANAAGRASITNVDLDCQGFSKSWTKTWIIESDNCGSMTVGYDTWWTKEDYVDKFGMYSDNKHFAKVENSNGVTASTNRVGKNSVTGKADVKHTGNTVTYHAVWGCG